MSLYASREGALYQSYDNYAGAQGFYEPEQPQGGMPQPPAGLTTTGIDQYAQMYPQQSPQRAIFQEFQNYYQQPELMYAQGGQPHVEHQMQVVQKTVMMPVVRQQPVVTQAVHPVVQQLQFAPVQYTSELRGVGIKFGEKIDPQTGGMTVYVKRLVRGGPADQCGQIQPGDTLLLINSEDVYGLGLDVLRNKIPGPAGTSVRLGFKNIQGQMYEVNLPRTAYGDNRAPAPAPAMPQPQMVQPPMPPQPQMVQQQMMMPPQQQTIMVPQQQMQVPQPQMQFIQQPPQQQTVMLMQQPQQVVQQPQFVMQQQPQFQVVQQPPQQQVQYVVQQPQFQPQPQQQVQYVIEQPQFQPQPQVQYQQVQQPVQQYQQVQPQFQAAPAPAPQPQYQQYQPQEQYQPQQQYGGQQDWYGDGVQGTQV